MSTGRRLALLGAVIVLAIAGFVIASNDGSQKTGSSSQTTTTTTPAATTTATKPAKLAIPVHRIVVRNAKPVGGVQQIKVKKGDRVKIAVTSDVADEVHLHGYDLMKDVKPGGTVRFDFKADADGQYELELESRKEQIAQLTVEP
jgi:heme/copper-type cytochrome/quinol oxidase subunit 2